MYASYDAVEVVDLEAETSEDVACATGLCRVEDGLIFCRYSGGGGGGGFL